jgi:hypothetical protein
MGVAKSFVKQLAGDLNRTSQDGCAAGGQLTFLHYQPPPLFVGNVRTRRKRTTNATPTAQ